MNDAEILRAAKAFRDAYEWWKRCEREEEAAEARLEEQQGLASNAVAKSMEARKKLLRTVLGLPELEGELIQAVRGK